MKILSESPLNHWHTFRTGGYANRVLILDHFDDLPNLKKEFDLLPKPFVFVGQGSNLLFKSYSIPSLIHNDLKHFEILRNDNDRLIIRAGGGLVWDDFVSLCLDHDCFGLENLSGIPGTVACSAVQNIGAYGSEVSEFIHRVHVFNMNDGSDFWISKKNCHYTYRNSIFKSNKHFFVLEVEFALSLLPVINLKYKAIKDWFSEKNNQSISSLDVRNAVLSIRSSKLPDPAIIGNAGSFFMNPIVSKDILEKLESQYADIVSFPVNDDSVKLSAAWLIDKAGWKGYRDGDAGVNPHQALVLVNYGNASGNDIYNLSEKIRNDVLAKFDVQIMPEVVII